MSYTRCPHEYASPNPANACYDWFLHVEVLLYAFAAASAVIVLIAAAAPDRDPLAFCSEHFGQFAVRVTKIRGRYGV